MRTNQTKTNTPLKVSKLEAARRQLESAIAFYFNEGDPVSTHTLATAALEILRDLNKHRGGSKMLYDLDAVEPQHREIVLKKFREAQNFFKHADKDPEGVVHFNPEQTVFFIFEAVETYRKLSAENPPLLRVFSLWFRTSWPEVFIFTVQEQANFALVRSLFQLSNKTKFFTHFLPLYVAESAKTSRLRSQ